MNVRFIGRVGSFLKSHLNESVISEELGCCMDDIILDYIPPTWPVITQAYLIANLLDNIYDLAENPVSHLASA